ncbi:unnamed protein product [Sphagnum jensenii]|uniref:Uncharacterized protein n=1 Tax=Sphagnum jensenii TaxID=128206 RepID=A0ABP1B8Z0_9BRYO
MMSKQRELDLTDIGKKLANAQSKEALMNLLPQAASMLEDVEQSPPPSTIFAMKGCSDALVDPTLLGHKDKDVGVLVALCISEIMRIVAPDAPYSDDCLKEIFQLIVGIFRGLDDVHSPSFSSRVNILETVAKVRSCVVMLDLDCDDLITEMFEIFFTTISDKHPEPVFLAMRNVLSLVINEGEEVSSQILEVILNNLLRQKEEVAADVTKEGGGLEEQDADETNKVATEGTEGSGLEKQDADETNKVVTEGTEGSRLEKQDADETSEVTTEGTEGSGLEKQDADDTNKVATEGTEGSRLEKQDADETNEVTTEGTEGSRLEKQDADETNEVTTEGTEGSGLEKQDADETNEVTTEGTEGSELEKQDADETNKVTTEGRGLEKHDADEINEDADAANNDEDQVVGDEKKGLTEKEHDAGMSHEGRSEGREEDRVKDQVEDEIKDREETQAKMDPEEDGKDEEEGDGGVVPQKPDTQEDEDGKDEEEGDGGVVPQKPDTQEDEGGKDEEEGDGGVVPQKPDAQEDRETEQEEEKEITQKADTEDQEENQPAKHKHLPEDSSRNDAEEAGSLEDSSKNHAVEVSSKDKDEEEVAVGVDHQDVEQMPTQTDKEGEEKDVVENLSAKRKAGRPKGSAAKNKRKLSVGDEKASESHEEVLGPKHKRGRGHIESSDKKEIITEDEGSVSTTHKNQGHPKSSGKKAITRKAGGDGKGRQKEEQMEEEGQTAKSKPGRPKSTGKKEIRSTAGIDVKTGQKHEEKNNINTPKTKTKPGRTKGSINKAVREVSSGDEKASSTDKGKEDLVGCGIKVWWPLDRRFYKGEVISYDAKKKRHKVLYDDGEQEILDLGVERWQLTTKKQRLVKVGSSCPMDGFVPFPILWPSLDLMKQRSSSKSGKKRVSQEGKSNNLEARFLKDKETPVKNTISEFDFDEDNDDDGEAPKGGKMKGKQVQSSSTSKGSSGKVFKQSVGDSSTEKPTTSRDSEGDAAAALSPDMSPGDGEPLNTWVIRRQKAH